MRLKRAVQRASFVTSVQAGLNPGLPRSPGSVVGFMGADSIINLEGTPGESVCLGVCVWVCV